MKFISFFLPHFPGAPRSERPLLLRRAGASWEGPVIFGRNRESRTREAAGRRNWPEAVPKKMRARKSVLTGVSCNGREEHVALCSRLWQFAGLGVPFKEPILLVLVALVRASV